MVVYVEPDSSLLTCGSQVRAHGFFSVGQFYDPVTCFATLLYGSDLVPLPIGAVGCPQSGVHSWSMAVVFFDFDSHYESGVGGDAFEHAVLTGVIVESV